MARRCVKCGARLRSRRVARGRGPLDWLKRGWNRAKDYLQPLKDQYTRGTAATLARYGSGVVTGVTVFRKPLSSMLDTLANALTLGKFSGMKARAGYEKFFHLGTYVTLSLPGGGGVGVIVEKNEVISVTAAGSPPSGAGAETVPATPPTTPLTLYALLENTRAAMGDAEFFSYRAMPIDGKPANNCQVFVRSLLAANGMLTPELEGFIMQPLEALAAELPGFIKDTAQFATDAAGTARKVLGLGRLHRRRHAGSGRRAHWKRAAY